jgi:hypothetical protein
LPYLYDIFTKSGIASPAVVGPRKVGRELYVVLEVLVFSSGYAALYWGMVTAFHLLNLPSDKAVLGGLCLLFLIAAGGFIAFKRIWRF